MAAAASQPQTIPPIPEIVSDITAGGGASLSGVQDLDVFAIDDGLYVAAVASGGDAILVINITDPYNPKVISSVADDGATVLGGASAVDIIRIGSSLYAAIASASDDGLQILNLTDPAGPVPVAAITDDGTVALAGAYDVDTFAAGSGLYAVVASASDDGLQVVEITDPAGPVPVAAITDDGTVAPDGEVAVDTIQIGSDLYAVIASASDDSLLIFNLTHPADPVPVAGLTDDTSVHLHGARDVVALDLGSKVWALVASDDGLQVVDITDPTGPVPVAVVPDGSVHAALRGASAVDTFMMNGGTYAVIATADGIAVVDPAVVDPAGPVPVKAAQNNSTTPLGGASAIKTFYAAGHVYAAVAVPDGGGAIRIVSLGEMDSVPPTISSATWTPANRTIALVFSEPLNHTATDYRGIAVLGESANLTLADTASRTATGRATAAALSPAQEAALGVPGVVRLLEGAVQDMSGNPIPPTDMAVTMADSVPPTISSATYEPGTGILAISFSEPLNHTATIYHDIAVAGPVRGDALRIAMLLAFIYPDIAVAGPVHLYTLDQTAIGTASGMTIKITLDAAQMDAVGSAPILYMMEGAVRDISGNPVGVVRGLDVTVLAADAPDITPPAPISSSYNTGTGILNVAFSEPLNGTTIHYDRIAVRDAGQSSGGLTLDGVTSHTLNANSTAITLTLSATQRQMINAMAAPQLDIGMDAVTDIAGNGISAVPDLPITIIDGIPPTVVSATYNPGNGMLVITNNTIMEINAAHDTDPGMLVITFSEPLGPAIDYSGVSVVGPTGSVTLDMVASKSHSGRTITATLDAAQRDTAGDSPTLSVSAGAVTDVSGNPISPVSHLQIIVEATPVLIIPAEPPAARDATTPHLLSSYYNTGTGALNMTFSEPLRPQINYTGIILVGPSQNVTLDTVAVKNHTGNVINATLDGPQRTTIGDMPSLSIEAGAVSDRSGNPVPHTNGTITVIDGIPPEFVSASYNTGTGVLNVTFSEPLELASIRYDLVHIRDAGQAAGGISLGDVTTRTVDPSSVTLTLSDAQRRTVNDMTAPELDIDAGAVYDIGQNQITASPNRPITIIDGIAPTVVSVAYNTGTGILVVVFSEPLGPTVDYSGVSIMGPTDRVTLNDVATKDASGERITATLGAAQRATAGDSPTLSVSAGAVFDMAGNPILSATPAVTTIDGIPPTISSSSYNTGTGILAISFSEPLDLSINYTGFTLTGPSQSVTLDAVASKSHSGQTITATLNTTQRDTAGDAPTLSVSAGAVSDLHGNPVASATPALTVIDGIPPALVSSSYNTGTGILNVTFSEPLGSTIRYDRIAVRDTGQSSGGLALNAVTSKTLDSSSTTITLTLSAPQRQTVNGMATPQLDITADAVADPSGNGISAAQDLSITVIDGIPPTVSSATYNTGTGILNITFSEPLGSAVVYSGMVLAGENGNVALDDVSTKNHSGDTLTATLNATQRTTVGDTITLTVSGGAVADPTGNDIAQTTVTIVVTDGIPPTLISSSYNTGTGILNITFSEPLGSTIHYDRLHIRDTGQSSGGLALDAVVSKTLDSASTVMTVTLSAPQRQTVNGMATPQLDITAGAVADPSGNGISAAPDQGITVIDGIPPTVSSAAYNTGTGILNVTFSEPLGSTIHYDRLHIRDAGQSSGGLTLSDVATKALDSSSTTMTVTLSAPQRQTVSGMATPQLDIAAGAVADTAGNGISAVQDLSITVIDTTPPTLLSASYNTDTGILSITFSEPLNRTATDYSGLTVSGQSDNVTLNQIDTKMTGISTIWATLNAAQMETAGTAPTLTISGGAVADIAGNRIEQATGTIEVTMLGLPITEIRPVGAITHDENTKLRAAAQLDLFEIGSNTYAIVTASPVNAVQIINLTDPATPTAVSSVTDSVGGFDELNGAWGVDTFEIAGRTYAAVTAYIDNGVQIINLTDPATPTAVSSVTDGADGFNTLNTAWGVDTFEIAGRTYAAVTAVGDDGVQIINLTDPATPTAVSSVTDGSGGFNTLDAPYATDIFAIGGRTYAAVTAYTDDGIQIINLTDPASPSPTANLTNTALTKLDGAWGVDTFEIAGRTYAAVTAVRDNGVQIIDLTDPATPTAVSSVTNGADGFNTLGAPYATDIFTIGGRTYAAVTAYIDNGVQIIELTDPATPSPAAHLTDTALTKLFNPWGVDTFAIEGRTYAAVAAYNDNGVQILQLHTDADIPPAFVSATYNMTSSALLVTFNKDINGAATDYSLLHIREPNQDTGGATLADSTSKTTANRTLTVILDDATAMTVNAMVEPQLDIDHGAVTDTYGNQITAAPDQSINVIDVTPPTLLSASYNTDTGILNITFSEPLNHTATDYSELTIRGQMANVTLDQVATKTTGISTIWATLNATQMETAGTAPTLAIGEGAVRDLADNRIVQATGTIKVTMLGPPIIEIRPVASLSNTSTRELDGASDVDTFTIGGNTYAIVTARFDDGVQIIDITDPTKPRPAGYIRDTSTTELDGAWGADTFTIGSNTYAIVAGNGDDGIQILNITDPASPAALARLVNGGSAKLNNPVHPEIFQTGGHTYAIVPAYDSNAVQIINVTDPTSPSPTDSITDTGRTALRGPFRTAVFELDDRTYAMVGSLTEKGIQIINITNPVDIRPLGKITSRNAQTTGLGVIQSGGITYGIAAATGSSEVRIINITSPASPALMDTLYLARTWGALDVFEWDNRAYILHGSTSDYLRVYDITDPADATYAHRIRDDAMTKFNNPYGVSVFQADSKLYAIAAAYDDDGIQIVALLTERDFPPLLGSAKYGVFNRTISLQFDKDIDGSKTNYTRIHIRDAGQDTGGISLDAAISNKTVGSRIMATFDSAAADTILAMANSTLDIEAGAVTDIYGNRIENVTDQTVERIFTKEVLPPEIVSAGYGVLNSTLRITFDKDLNHNSTDYSGMRVRDIVGGGGIQLTEASLTEATGNTVTVVFGEVHSGTIGGMMVDPHLVVEAGAATDTYGNLIEGTALHIDVDRPYAISYAAHLDLDIRQTGAQGVGTWTDNGRVYALAMYHLSNRVLNITDPYNPAILHEGLRVDGEIISPFSLQMVEIDGRAHAWVFGRVYNSDTSGLHLFDLGDPTAPSYVHSINGTFGNKRYEHGSNIYQIKFISAPYTRSNAMLQIINVTDPATPATVGSLNYFMSYRGDSLAGNIADFDADGQKYILLASVGMYLGDVRVFAINVTDPTNPAILSNIKIDGVSTASGRSPSVDLAVYEFDGRPYAAIPGSPTSTNAISVLNLTNPANLTISGSTAAPGAFDMDLFESGNRTYALLGVTQRYLSSGAAVVDITSPANPTVAARSGAPYLNLHIPHISHFEMGGQDYAVGATTYIPSDSSNTHARVLVMRLSSSATDDAPPTLASAWYRYDGLLNMTFAEELGGSVYPNLIRIRDADQPSGPYLQGAVRTAISGDTAAVWLNSTQMAAVEALDLPVLDIGPGAVSDVSGNPAPKTLGHSVDVVSYTLTRVGTLPDRVRAAYLYESGGHQYAAMTQGSVPGTGDPYITSIYNASDPLRPTLLGAAYEDHTGNYLEVTDHFEHGGRTYLVIINENGSPGLAVVDVTDLSRAETVSQLDRIGAGDAVTAKIFWRDDIPYMSAASEGTALILNMSDPANPAEISEYPIFGFQYGVTHFESGGSTYAVLNTYAVVSVFDVSDPAKPVLTDTMRAYREMSYSTTFGGDSYVLLGQVIVDVADPRDITLAGFAGVPSGRYGTPSVFMVGERVYAATVIGDISVLDISDPFEPRRVVFSERSHKYADVHQADNKTYVYAAGGIHLFEEYLPTVPVPPALESALYNPGNRFVGLNFSEPVRWNATDIHIRPVGHSTGGVALTDTPVVKGSTLTFALTADQAGMIDAMGTPLKVDMERGAVLDLDGTPSEMSSENPVTVRDSTPPRPVSAVLYVNGSVLAVTFDEPLNRSVSPDGMSVLGDPQLSVVRFSKYEYSGDHMSLTGFSPVVSGSMCCICWTRTRPTA